MKKYLFFLFFTIVVGCVSGKFLYDKTINVSARGSEDVYFLELMSSIDLDELKKDSKDIEPKVIVKNKNGYSCIVAISKKKDNINKIKEKYTKEGYLLSFNSRKVLSDEFLNNLEQFDQLLVKVNNEEEIIAINSVILSSYESMVLKR